MRFHETMILWLWSKCYKQIVASQFAHNATDRFLIFKFLASNHISMRLLSLIVRKSHVMICHPRKFMCMLFGVMLCTRIILFHVYLNDWTERCVYIYIYTRRPFSCWVQRVPVVHKGLVSRYPKCWPLVCATHNLFASCFLMTRSADESVLSLCKIQHKGGPVVKGG